MLDFAAEIKYGAERRFQYAKEHLKDVAGAWYEEVRHIANELYACGYTSQAKKFVELAYLHLHNKDMERYNIVRHQYGGLAVVVTDRSAPPSSDGRSEEVRQ